MMGVVNHVVKVRRRTVSVCDARIVANNVDVDTVTLDLDSEWNGLSTVVAFGDGDDQVMVSVGVEPVEIPRSLTTASGYLPVTVIGYGGDGLPRMVTAAAPHAMIIVNSGVIPDQSYPDAPDLIGQLVTAGDKANEAADNANAAAERADAAAEAVGEAASSASAAKASETAAASSATAAAGSAAAAKASETAASQSAQTATEQVSSIGDSVERAAASATAAQQSASQAQSNATAADSSAQAAAASAESAQTAAESAASSKDAAARSASEASASAQAAETSKTNAAALASAAKISETNAAASATAAQNAVDGFGLTVGTTTTGEPGTDASVNITKQGMKYVADFTIPQGQEGTEGPKGPKGDPGDLTTVAHDETLDGDGTNSNPLKVVKTSGITLYKGWQDPAETGTNLNNGDLWLKTPHYLTDLDPDNPTEGASTAEYYTYAQGAADNSPSVLVRTGQVVTDMLEYSNGAWWSLIWRVDSSLTPGKETAQVSVARTLSETELITRIEALEVEVKSLKGVE